MQNSSSIDHLEVEKFSKMAHEWWDPNGKLSTLHDINPLRISYILSKISEHLPQKEKDSLKNLNILDVGCGGGLLSEPLARLGASITGIDASEKSINIAKTHAKEHGLNINYICTTAEGLKKKHKFDIVCCLELIEHVENPALLIQSCSNLLKTEGLLFISTINRTLSSYVQTILGAEYVLRWVPIGTHSWKKYFKPSELDRLLSRNTLNILDMKGLEYHPFAYDKWSLRDKLDVNYILVAKKQ